MITKPAHVRGAHVVRFLLALVFFATIRVWEVRPMSVSAYAEHGVTASGQATRAGTCACGPSFEFGTRFYVSGAGWVTCWDRGSRIDDAHLDIWMGDEEGAWEWGRRTVEVVVG